MNRREFLQGTVASGILTLAGWRTFAEENALPAYYGDYLAGVADRVRALAASGRDAFWFLTDPHVPDNRRRSGFVLAELIRQTGVSKVFCGGDIPNAFGTRERVMKSMETLRTHWIEPIERVGGRFYLAKGNHDFTIRVSMSSQDGFTLDARASRAFILSSKAAQGVTTNADDPEGAYFYFDEPQAKIRYIFADTTDSILATRPHWAVMSGVHEKQLAWLRERAFGTLPPAYETVVVHHIPITGVVGNEGEIRTFANLRALVNDPKSRTILDLTGHHHREAQTCQGGVWHVTEPCDAAYSDYINGSKPWCPDLPKKTAGTVFENTFDAVILGGDGKKIDFVRVGGGADRTLWRTGAVSAVGETHPFASALPGAAWGCYDADRVAFKPDPSNRWNKLIEYKTQFGTVDANGRFTARAPGEAVIVARAADNRKELFPVTITAK